MLKKICMVSMVVLMLAGVVFSVANFTAPDLEAADIVPQAPVPYGAWSPFIEGVSYCWPHPLCMCVVGAMQFEPQPQP